MYKDVFIRDFAALGRKMEELLNNTNGDSPFYLCMDKAYKENDLFTLRMQEISIRSVLSALLREGELAKWILPYHKRIKQNDKRALLVMAGNIPLVGFHDLLSVLACGCKAVIKCSSKDKVLLPYITDILFSIDSFWRERITYTDSIDEQCDMVIATGGDKAAEYFKNKFQNKPALVRGAKYSFAVLTGNEDNRQLEALGKDIFYYYGMGCRSVSLLLVPYEYNLELLVERLSFFCPLLSGSSSFFNSYRYQKAIAQMNGEWMIDGEFFILKKGTQYPPPLSVVNVLEYSSMDAVRRFVNQQKNSTQCVVRSDVSGSVTEFGMSQYPALWEYADGINSLEFIIKNS